jgi:hypothetical protein
MQPADLRDGRWACRRLSLLTLDTPGANAIGGNVVLKGHGTKSVGWQQSAKGLPQTSSDGEKAYELRDPMAQSLERLKWFLWHRNVYQALQVIQSVGMDLEVAVADTRESMAQKPLKPCMEPPTLMPDLTGEHCEAIVRTSREGQQGTARWPYSETDSLRPPGR